MATTVEERAYLLGVLGMTVDNPSISLAQLNLLARIPLEVRQLSPLFDNAGKFADGTGLNNVADQLEPDQNNLLSVGEETWPRLAGFSTSQAALASGTIGLSYFTCRKTEVSTQIRVPTGNTVAAATPTLCKIGIYSVAANGDLTLVASIANDTTLFATTFTNYTRSWVAPFTKIAGQRYAVAQIVVSGAARPNFLVVGAALNVAELFIAPAIGAQLVGQVDLPASITAASLIAPTAGSATSFYAAVLP